MTEQAGLGAFAHTTGAFGEMWFPETVGSGCAFLDYNGDGWTDVLLVGGGTWAGHRRRTRQRTLWLYRNDGDGTFSLTTREAGLGEAKYYGMGVAAADYDNDGDQDLYLTTLRRDRLYRNEGDGTFTEVARDAGLAAPPYWSSSAIFFDADRDGYLDLYVGGYVNWSPQTDCSLTGGEKGYCTPDNYEGAPSRFYHNDGDGTFSDWTKKAGFLPAPGKTLGAATLDYNDDGWPDLAVANDMARNLLYRNNGDGTFTERGTMSGIAYEKDGGARAGMGIDVGVVDSTGRETIFVGNFSEETIGVFRYAGAGFFVDRAASSQVGQPSLLTLTFGLFLFDADLDADLDLFAANGHVHPRVKQMNDALSYRQRPQLFLNRGNGTFREVERESSSVFTKALVARGAAYGDYDHDGDLDVLLTENGGPAHLWQNRLRQKRQTSEHTAPHYLRVGLRGRESNRDGIGARVVAVVGERRMQRRLRTGTSYLSQPERTMTFGLGSAGQVDTLRVRWPSGQTDEVTNVASNQTVRLVEGRQETVPLAPPGSDSTASTLAQR